MDVKRARALLLELTGLPTAAGREDAVVRSVRSWAKRRKRIEVSEDPAGNLTLRCRDERGQGPPVCLVAHTDHPAAVVTGAEPGKPRRVRASFLGGVSMGHFKGSAMRLHRAKGAPLRGVVMRAEPGAGSDRPGERGDPELTLAFGRDPDAQPGDLLTWDLGGSVVRGTRLHAPACDDLAGVAAALATLDSASRARPGDAAPLRVLLTRAEEVGFVGAVAACRAGTIPADARVVVIECSKASDDAPIGAGPVVRVGDRSSTFDPALTGAIAATATALEAEGGPGGGKAADAFRWQRKLMTGGTCEATAYAAFGLASTCVCLPLGNYHNMSDAKPDTIEREVISLRDFEGLCRLLVRLPRGLGPAADPSAMRDRLEGIHEARAGLLRPIPG